MNGPERSRLTFARLDREKGIPDPPPDVGEDYPLPAWYRGVREIPLEELGMEDICKACRQQVHLEHVVPIALRQLQSEPLAGGMFDGELLASLKSVGTDYWRSHVAEATMLKLVCERIKAQAGLSDDVRQDVMELLTKMTRVRQAGST